MRSGVDNTHDTFLLVMACNDNESPTSLEVRHICIRRG